MFKSFRAVIPGQRNRQDQSSKQLADTSGSAKNSNSKPKNLQPEDGELENNQLDSSVDGGVVSAGADGETLEASAAQKAAQTLNKKSNAAKRAKKPSAAQVNASKSLSAAVDLARNVLSRSVDNAGDIGEHVDFEMIDDSIGVHSFRSNLKGYNNWKWFIYMSKLPNSKISIIEVSHLPDESALLAPKWIPWNERIKPSDIMEYDELPYNFDDSRLVDISNLNNSQDLNVLGRTALAKNRLMILSAKNDVADRWYRGNSGPHTASTRISLANCMSCGFFVPIEGDLGQLFGVCANLWSRDDARVVSSDHGCGMHSETDTSRQKKRWSPSKTVIDQTTDVDLFKLVGQNKKKSKEI